MPYPYGVNFLAKRRIASLTFSIFALSLISISLTGCAAGPNAATRTITQVTDGVDGASGSIKFRNITLVVGAEGTAVLVGTIVNHDELQDALIGIAINGNQVTFGRDGAVVDALPLDLNKPVIFSGPSANAFAFTTGFDVKPGYRVPVSFLLAKGGIVNLSVLVRERAAEFAEVLPPTSVSESEPEANSDEAPASQS